MLCFTRSGGFGVNKVVGDDVLEACIISEEVIRLSNAELDGFVKIDDFILVSDIGVSCELPSHVLVVVFKFAQPVGIHKEDGSGVSGICNHPFPIDTDFLGGFPTAPSGVNADVEVTDCLCLSVVRFEGIIS